MGQRMTDEVYASNFREIFQKGRWTLRKVGESPSLKYLTTSQRNNAWRTLLYKEDDKRKISSNIVPDRVKNGKKREFENIGTETSRIMKRDLLGRVNPWISTTHKDFYGQAHPKCTEKRSKITLTPSRLDHIEDIVGCVTHVPLVRMSCHNDEHFASTYQRHFKAMTQDLKHSLGTEEDFNLSYKPAKFAIPYGSKNWITSYKFDYCQSGDQEASMELAQPTVIDPEFEEGLEREPLYKLDYTTTYQDYGRKKDMTFMDLKPLRRDAEDCHNTNKIHVPKVTSEVGRLMKY